MYCENCETMTPTSKWEISYIGHAGSGLECPGCKGVFHKRVKWTQGLLMGEFFTNTLGKVVGARASEGEGLVRGW